MRWSNEWLDEWMKWHYQCALIHTKRESQMLNPNAVQLYVCVCACCWLAWFWKYLMCCVCMWVHSFVLDVCVCACVCTGVLVLCYHLRTERANRPKRDKYMFVHKSQLRCWYSQTVVGCRMKERTTLLTLLSPRHTHMHAPKCTYTKCSIPDIILLHRHTHTCKQAHQHHRTIGMDLSQ